MTVRCDFRTHRECACLNGTCQQVIAIPAPAIHAVWKDFAMFFGAAIIITIATLCAVSEAEKQFKLEDLRNQESSYVPAEYRSLAVKAMNDALEYRIEAITAAEYRQQTLVKWASQREADASFYASRADMQEDFATRHAPKQEAEAA